MDILTVRQQYPQYNDLSDQQLADALHKQYYSDMPKEQVYQKLGLQTQGQSKLDTALGAATSAAKGVPLIGTYLDEVASGIQAGVIDPMMGKGGTFGERYDTAMKNAAQLDKGFETNHPIASTVLPIGTGVASGVGIGGRLLNPTSAMGAAGSGALMGAAYNSGENPQDRLGAGIMGAVGGGILGYAGGKIAEKLAPKAQTTSQDFIDSYVNKKSILRNQSVSGADMESRLREVLRERAGQAYGDNFQFPPEYAPYLKNGGDLYSIDSLRSGEKNLHLKEGLKQLIADQVPTDFRADYARAMQLEQLDNRLAAAGGDPLKTQTQMRQFAKNDLLPQEVRDAANKAGEEGVIRGLATGKTGPLVAGILGAVESTPLIGGAAIGARALAKSSIDRDVDALRGVITGDTQQGLATRVGGLLSTKIKKLGGLLGL